MKVLKKIEITKELVNAYASLTGDHNPIHLNNEYAKESSFGKCIAHGMLLSSFFSTLISSEYPGPGSIYLSQDVKFLKPCFVGEWIKVKIELIDEIKKTNSTIYKLSTQILNTDNDVLIDGGATVFLSNQNRIS
jgi:3-hydroxybutyryl-CoA dehydratase